MSFNFKYKFLMASYISKFMNKKKNYNKILLYHKVVDQFNNDIFSVDQNSFFDQINFLYEKKFNVVNLKKNHIGDKNISITFDDGYLNNFNPASQILKKFGFPATFFINTSKIDKDKNYLTSSLIKEMDTDIFDFGIHGHNHLSFCDLSNSEIKNQIYNCKSFLEDLLQKKIDTLSYPNGSLDSRVKEVVRSCQISFAYDSTNKSYKSLSADFDYLQIPRISIWNLDNIRSFNNKLYGKWDWISYIS